MLCVSPRDGSKRDGFIDTTYYKGRAGFSGVSGGVAGSVAPLTWDSLDAAWTWMDGHSYLCDQDYKTE
jgi:hypothetical protein